jgi:hypothetical protein
MELQEKVQVSAQAPPGGSGVCTPSTSGAGPSGNLSTMVQLSHPSSWGYLILGSGGQLSGCRGIARGTLCSACEWYKPGMMVVTGSPCSARNLGDEIPSP